MHKHSAIYGLAGVVTLALVSMPFSVAEAAAQHHSYRHAQKAHVAKYSPVRHARVAMRSRDGVPTLVGYGPVAQGAPVLGAPFGYSGCYGSREQIYVAGQGLVWRPRVDCPYKDFP